MYAPFFKPDILRNKWRKTFLIERIIFAFFIKMFHVEH